MLKGLFYDSSATMLLKNHSPISNIFSSKNSNFKSVFVSNETSSNLDSEHNYLCERNLLKLNNSSYFKLKTFNHKKISKFLEDFDPDFVFIGGYRIYDQLITAICNINNIKIYKIQHGFEIDTVNYRLRSVLFKTVKVLRILNCSYNLALISKSSPFQLTLQYVNYFFNGISLKNTLLDNVLFHPTILFVYSEYYKDFWFNKFGLIKENMCNITPPDFLMVDKVSTQKQQQGCCYIAQTLVEDGRMSENEFRDLLTEYESIAKCVEVFIIKLHPRSELKYYENISKLKNVKITNDFPNCTSYLTHYSSLLYTAAFLSEYLILHELKSHKTHEIFKKVNPLIVNSTKEIITFLTKKISNEKISINKRKKELKYFADFENINPYEQVYNTIISLN